MSEFVKQISHYITMLVANDEDPISWLTVNNTVNDICSIVMVILMMIYGVMLAVGIAGSVCQIKDFINNRKEIAAEKE